MHFTIRQKLSIGMGIAALGYAVILISGAVITARVNRHLNTLQQRFIPLVELRPRLEGKFDQLAFAFQDAVAAQSDSDLPATTVIKDELLQDIAAAEGVLGQQTAAALESAVEEYHQSAYAISQRLIAGDAGVGAVDAMMGLQARHAQVLRLLDQATIFNREALVEAFRSTGQVLAVADRQRTFVAIVSILAVMLLAIWVMRSLYFSISLLKEGFLRFGNGNFTAPIQANRYDELGEVALSANQMAAQIQRLLEESRQKTEALGVANNLLAATNHELETFSYSVSHDLRAPLRAIDGFSRALLTDYVDKLDDQGRHYLERVRAGTQRMSRLIDDILSLSRISRAPVHAEEVDLTAMARAILADFAAQDPERNVQTEVAEGLRARGDARLLQTALENLLGNAWKFSSKQASARIVVGSTRSKEEEVFFVKDNGAGFDMAQSGKLFGAFQRLHTNSEFEGTGVGLANVQRVVHRHGGRIWAEGAPGKGATFFFTLGAMR